MSVAFILNKIFVFPKSSKAYHKQARDFIIINLCFWPIVWAASIEIKILLEYLGVITVYAENIAHLAALSLPICASFFIYKFYAFK
jgi:putative flippase GtrA